jgi:hypothetical protein
MQARPGFGTPKQLPQYYVSVSSIVSVLKPYSTLRTISGHLNGQGFRTPSGMKWSKQAVANFIRSPHYINTQGGVK